MKPWIKFLFAAIIIFAFFFLATYFFLVFQGRNLLIRRLEAATGRKVSVGSFVLLPPLNLEIKNLNIEGMAKIDSLFISPSIPRLLLGKIALNEITLNKPEFIYEKKLPPQEAISQNTSADTAGQVAGAQLQQQKPSLPAPEKKLAREYKINLVIKRLRIKDGKINFSDETAGKEGIKILVKDINFNLTNLYLVPRNVITDFDLKGRIPWQKNGEEGIIAAEGWLNLYKKNMQAALKIEEIDGIYLYPYYSNWVDLEKARIEKAKLKFTSNISGLNNNVTADCHLELSGIVRRELKPEEQSEKAAKITDAVLDIFRTLDQGKIVLDFTIRTKMDRPQFGFGNIKMAFEDKLASGRKAGALEIQDALSIPAKLLQGTFKGATELTKAVISGTISVGKEIGKALEDSFKKEKKK